MVVTAEPLEGMARTFIRALLVILSVLSASSFHFAAQAFFATPAFADAPPTGEIVGGGPASPGAWPFMAAIIQKNSFPPKDGQYCGGSLISPTWVLSAAHCFRENGTTTAASQVQVALGYTNLRTDSGEIKNVSRIIVHPSYNESTSENDLALLELSSASSKTPILLVSSSTNLTGLTATAIGWGLTDPNNDNSSPDVLQQVNLPVVSNATCNGVYGSIVGSMVCAGYAQGGKDSCQGDSGGPLVINDFGVTKLIGATSFGSGCAEPNAYGVYTRVASFESFISQYVTFGRTDPTDGDYGLWNGYLGMVNIVELQNRSGATVTGQVNVFNSQGTLVSSNYVAIAANSQQDVVLNGLAGFGADNFGIVQISSNVEGRIFYYRPVGGIFTNFEYVAGVRMTPARTGNAYVGFNTYQPSGNAAELGNVVANWLSIVNLSATAQTFTVRKFNFNGGLISSTAVSIPASSRLDLEGGHLDPGPFNIGLIEVIPQSGSTQYLAQLWRYGYGNNGTFDFAFPLIARSGTSSMLTVPLGSQYSAQNWLEVATTGSAVVVDVAFYNAGGALLTTQVLNLESHGQFHINATAILGANAIGYARITPRTSVGLVAQSMFYFRNDTTGSITSMYGSQAASPVTTAANGTYNLFLGMENYLKLTNPTNSAIQVDVDVTSNFSAGSSRTVTLPANSSQQLSLHDTGEFGTAVDTYGVVTVTPVSAAKVSHEILRLKREVNGQIQFAAPTALD